MIIRDARRADIGAVAALLADDVLGRERETPGDPAYLVAFERMRGQSGNHLLVAEDDEGRVVGCLQLLILPGLARKGATRAQVEGVRVAAAARGRKVGEALMDEAIGRARAAGCVLAQLTTDLTREDAHRFYEKFGFRRTHLGMKMTL